ncbi:MAG: phosphoglycerate dehydrogenase [Anaerolineales bacterium]|nr:phosphoglycerate dehydrogenase [Anaerolineales bacterium]
MIDLKSCCVLVTATSYAKSDPRLKTELEAAVGQVIYNSTGKPLSSGQVAELLPGCAGYIAGLDVIDRAALEAATQLKVIARYGSGVDRVDLQAAQEKGIIVTNTPSANATSVAELTIGLILALARCLPYANANTKAGEWPRLDGLSLEGKTVGLLGLGAIGKQVAHRLSGFDCTLLAYDPVINAETARIHNTRLAPLDEVVSQADFLSLHLPVLPETRGMINRSFLSKMKNGAFLINTARGELIDEAALFDALQSGHLRGAALDAFSPEPPRIDNPLLALPQVIATPHTGAHTDGATNAMGWTALQDCLAVLRGNQPKHRVI